MDSDNDEWSDWSGCEDYLLDTQTDEVNIVNENAGTAIPVDGSKREDEPETVSAGESNNGNLHDQGLTANKIEVTITNQRETPSTDDVITAGQTQTPSTDDVITEGQRETPSSDDVITERHTETPSTDDVSTEGQRETPSTDDVITEGQTETPRIDDVITEGQTETPSTDDVSTEGQTDTPSTDDVNTEGQTETPSTDDVITEGQRETPSTDDVITEDQIETPSTDDVNTEGQRETTSKGKVNNIPRQEESACWDQSSCNTDEDISLASLIRKINSRIHSSTKQSTDDDIPLASLKAKLTSMPRSPSPYDDSDSDESYRPTKEDVNISDSEDIRDILENNSNTESNDESFDENGKHSHVKKELFRGRDKQWKRKTNYIQRKTSRVFRVKPHTEMRKKIRKAIKEQQTKRLRKPTKLNTVREVVKSPSALQKIVELSRRQHQARQISEQYHIHRLDKLLASNGCKRVPVYADGDCLIKAVLNQLTDQTYTVDEMRTKISNHLLDNLHHYSGFIKLDENLSEDDQMDLMSRHAKQLEDNGHWQSDYADFVPLCLANILHRQIRIYSSRVFSPIFDIEPDLVTATGETLMLAHLATRGTEHYDSVRKIEKNDHGSSKSPLKRKQNVEDKTPTKTNNADHEFHTPHKAAKYISPPKRLLFRKRKSQPEEWKANKRKKRRDTGQEYVSKAGATVPARSVKSKDCQKCRFRCSEKVPEEERQNIFDLYWQLGDYDKQRSFICSNVSVADTKGVHLDKKRSKAFSFYFTVSNVKQRVCKAFFLKTLDIGKKTVDSAMNKMKNGVYVGSDKRGRNAPGNKTPKADDDFVHRHIRSFPVVESHYTRKDTRRQYLAPDLNIKKMYELYKEECKKEVRKPVSQMYYRKIFNNHYNLSFFQPKKDQCSVCTIYNQNKADGTLTPELEKKYTSHQNRKEESRREKSNDKLRTANKSFHVSTFDLQAVLSVPCSLVSDVYYKRKLSCYNLSFYNLGNKNGHCFLWDESQGGRGSCEVGTCLYLYINSIAGGVSPIKEVTLYSDTCGGQNRNRFIAAALHFTALNLPNIQRVNQKFFNLAIPKWKATQSTPLLKRQKRRQRCMCLHNGRQL